MVCLKEVVAQYRASEELRLWDDEVQIVGIPNPIIKSIA
jgi:hypothetical protein